MNFRTRSSRPARGLSGQNIVPMINVVFLLLIFFLMTAEIAPPDPFEIDPPTAEAEIAERGDETLYIDAEGRLAFGEFRDEAVFEALSTRDGGTPLRIRADAALPATALAAILPRLAEAGQSEVRLITASP